MEFAPADAASPDHIGYLDGVAATMGARTYKDGLLAALRLEAGHAVVDVGCGPGTDLRRLADVVGPGGRVLGVDRDPRMTREARRRHADHGGVSVLGGDAHALPLANAGFDRARVDRVTQHLPDPSRAMTELRRVHTVAYADYDAAEQVPGIRRSLVRAVHDGHLTENAARTWMDDLRTAPFTACVTIFTVTARR
jgi:SAM-dependent methyltransferase